MVDLLDADVILFYLKKKIKIEKINYNKGY